MSRYRLALFFTVFVVSAFLFIPASAQETTHTVQRGENLYRIALRYGISVDALIQANNITNPSRVFAGQELVIPNFDSSAEVVENPMVAGTPIFYTITGGDTLASIATRYGMTTEQLMQINNITNPDMIYRGQQLTVWATSDVEASTDLSGPQISVDEPLATTDTTTQAPPTTTYTIQPGEHLASIARRFGLSWAEIASANGLSDPNQIFAGQTIIIPDPLAVTDMGIVSAPAENITAIAPYPPTITVGKQVVVDLTHQMLYAYQDGQLVRSVVVSTGLPATPTVLGDYNVYVKYTAQTMSGPGYYLPDVPYVMYFYQGYSLHGTYWHNNFGNPMSHGCVNMPTPEAEWFFNNFVEVGTPIHVQY